jgi:hypothetical protein
VTNDREDDRTESVRSAWTRCLREEALRMRRPEVSRIAHVGIITATYADADGSNAFPSARTLAAIVGCTEETITRAMRVLVATGLLERKRRPNATPLHTLLMPLGPVDWAAHLHLYTDTRQAARKQRIKREEISLSTGEGGDGNPVQNGFRNPFPPGVPEPVPAGGSGTRSRGGFHDPGTRSGTGAEPGAERVPEPVPAGGVHSPLLPPVGDPPQDTELVEPVAQPQVGAREAATQDHFSPGLQALPGGGRGPVGDRQAPLLLSVQGGHASPLDHSLIAAHMTALYGAPVPVRRAATTAVEIVGDLDLPDPTTYVLGVLDADPGRYRPTLPASNPAPRRRAAGDTT